jgi:hypothetical protein
MLEWPGYTADNSISNTSTGIQTTQSVASDAELCQACMYMYM